MKRKITIAQVRALEKKLIVLEDRRQQVVHQTTPLKATLRKFIQQNAVAIQRYADRHGPGSSKLHWALDKIKRGYFGDAKLKDLIEIAHILKSVRWEE